MIMYVHRGPILYTMITFPSLYNFVFLGINNCLVFPFALFSRSLWLSFPIHSSSLSIQFSAQTYQITSCLSPVFLGTLHQGSLVWNSFSLGLIVFLLQISQQVQVSCFQTSSLFFLFLSFILLEYNFQYFLW